MKVGINGMGRMGVHLISVHGMYLLGSARSARLGKNRWPVTLLGDEARLLGDPAPGFSFPLQELCKFLR